MCGNEHSPELDARNISNNAMGKQEYEHCQHMLINSAAVISMLPLEEMLAAIDRTETIGPILDPTLYREGADSIETIKRIAVAALKLKNEVNKIKEEIKA